MTRASVATASPHGAGAVRAAGGGGVVLRPGAVTGALSLAVLALAAAHAAGLYARFAQGWPAETPWIAFFNFDTEANLPTWFSAGLLLAAAVLAGVIAAWRRRAGERFARHWAGLAVLFLFLSADEACSLHERLNDLPALQRSLSPSGALYYPWVAVYAALAGVLALAYVRFLASLPRRTAVSLALAGLLYAVGAVGLEMVGAAHDERFGRDNPGYAAVSTFEEALEMLGALLLIHALLAYPAKAAGGAPLRIRLGGDAE